MKDASVAVAQAAAKPVNEQKKHTQDDIENEARRRLRGFSRTIPSLLMAYGDGNTTLANFDELIPSTVFKDVAGITPEEFRSCAEVATIRTARPMKTSVLKGCLFNKTVFNNSARMFLDLREKPANRFDEDQTEDILGHIPLQKTNQVFTPGRMVDLFERESPGCSGDPDHTLADLRMESGMLVTANRQASLQQRSDASAVPR